eukprot:TRINITY_DN32781_c0_g1_i1.p1 TRINITY_DN32781_c0_g1~~TRINITY_DN32781_c0_g1_i1.p1  ORF type:complete len:644 (+),score=134.74 TRINITY_DN32781_c0_g1_i1:202-2133(+)
MDDDNENLFDEDENDDEYREDSGAQKELLVYLIDCSSDMFQTFATGDNDGPKTYFAAVADCIAEDLKLRVISRADDNIGVALFNTKSKKNNTESEGVYVLSGGGQPELGQPSAFLIKTMSRLPERFDPRMAHDPDYIGIGEELQPGSLDNPLFNALWVAQQMFRDGPVKNASKRIFLFTNRDDPFEGLDDATRKDMVRTTVQRAKDAQDIGVELELFPMSRPGEKFDVSKFYAKVIEVELDDPSGASFLHAAAERFNDLRLRIRKKTYAKRMVRRYKFMLGKDVVIELRSYAMIRPALIVKETYVEASSNRPVKTETARICADTGSVISGPIQRALYYGSQQATILFSPDEIKEVKKIEGTNLRLLGFKPLSCLKDYHNLAPPVFLYPDDEVIKGSMCAAIALHGAMLQRQSMALASWCKSSEVRVVALLPQAETTLNGVQLEPPGFQLIPLPFFDDVRLAEEYHPWISGNAPRASYAQVAQASELLRQFQLEEDFSLFQLQNPALQAHYAVLQAQALDEQELLQEEDVTMPNYERLSGPAESLALVQFKAEVYGADYDANEGMKAAASAQKAVEMEHKTKKRKADADDAASGINWQRLVMDNELQSVTSDNLKSFLRSKGLPLTGKKQDLMERVAKTVLGGR